MANGNGWGGELGYEYDGGYASPEYFPEYGYDVGGGDWPEVNGGGFDIPWSSLPALIGGGGVSGGGGIVPAAAGLGSIMRGGAAIAGAGMRTLGSLFRGAARAASFNINGVTGTLPQLWRYTRRFGPQAVAAALGVTVAELGALLMTAPDAGRTRRRRGISARDIRTTKRVVGFVSKMASTIGCVRAPAHFRRKRR